MFLEKDMETKKQAIDGGAGCSINQATPGDARSYRTLDQYMDREIERLEERIKHLRVTRDRCRNLKIMDADIEDLRLLSNFLY